MIRIQPGYSLRKVLDVYIVMSTGRGAYKPSCIMSVNEAGGFLWNLLIEGAELSDLVASLSEEYGIDAETAAQDVDKFLAQLREKALITE